MNNDILNELLVLLRTKPRPLWGKLKATLKVNHVTTLAGRKWRNYDDKGLELLIEIEELKRASAPKPKPKAKTNGKEKEEKERLSKGVK